MKGKKKKRGKLYRPVKLNPDDIVKEVQRLDDAMQKAIDEGRLLEAKRLAEEQEVLLEKIM